MNRRVLAFAVIAVIFMAQAACFIGLGHAATTKSHSDSLGFVMRQGNPNSYVEGAVTNAALVDGNLVLRVQPRGTYSLYTEELLLCGDPTDKIIGKSNPVVIIYETVSHRTMQGVGCHNLRYVDEVKITGGLQ